jgi:predicted NAD/FAD-dependent oxidoreductase
MRPEGDGGGGGGGGLFPLVDDVEYYPICATMITLDGTLDVPADGIEIADRGVGHPPERMGETFGTLGWISRDSSKPGRRPKGAGGSDDDVDDGGGGEECWVLHSTKEGARRMLEETKGGTLDEVREGIRRTMVGDFEKAMPLLLAASSATAATTAKAASRRPRPTVVHSAGHRWGAAFPAHVPGSALLGMDCHLDATRRVVACGDYFGANRGTAEGAYLSGRAAAERLMGQVNSQ